MELGAIRGIRVSNNAPMVVHLLFADDSIFFMRAAEAEARQVKNALTCYEKASGQQVNYHKTSVIFSKGTSEGRKRSVAGCLGVEAVDEHDKYMGLPTGADNGKRKIPWIALKRLCKPMSIGGLGFRDFHDFNIALLGKQAWRLLVNRDSLMSRVIRGKYFLNGSYMKASLGNNPSYTWSGFWEAKEVLNLGIRRRVSNGLST
ncbi:uncharacterized protein LOC141619182 [Silene latifolia]|uniref:uncharacterized protein LOC141619182 n=1 Tax=Silene latifolia TaxID=37657 RepID=UPI003D76EBD4